MLDASGRVGVRGVGSAPEAFWESRTLQNRGRALAGAAGAKGGAVGAGEGAAGEETPTRRMRLSLSSPPYGWCLLSPSQPHPVLVSGKDPAREPQEIQGHLERAAALEMSGNRSDPERRSFSTLESSTSPLPQRHQTRPPYLCSPTPPTPSLCLSESVLPGS